MTDQEKATLKRLNREHPTWWFSDIAKEMGKSPASVRYNARGLGLKSKGRKGGWNSKHKHLAKPVFEFFLTHTWEETQKHFNLTASELKSLFTTGYKNPKLAHLRKDKRRKDKWSLEEMLFLLQHAGIRERGWIAKKLKRGCATNIKERLQKWNAASKHLNGMPVSWALQLWPKIPLKVRIRTQAGPSGGAGIWRFCIIPWHDCLQLSQRYPTSPVIVSGIRGMIQFQQFVFQTQSQGLIRRKINQSAHKE